MRGIFLCVLSSIALAFAENVTTTTTLETEVIISTTQSSPSTLKVTEGTSTDSSPTILEVINSTTTESSPAESDKPSESSPSNTPSFQYFAVPFIPLNGLVQNFNGQYGVLPPVFGGMMNSVPQQTDRKQIKEPENEPQIPPGIERLAPAELPGFLKGINSVQQLTEMVFREMLNQQPGNRTCGGFIELEGPAEINHKISWGLPPVDVESCSWVIWAQRGGPIEIEFPKDARNAQFHHSLSSLWILNVNESLGYQKTLLKPGDVKTFATNFGATKGYYPFVIVHMLVKQTQPDHRPHLKFYDQAQGFRYQLRPNVKFLNESLTYFGRRATVAHPASRLSRYDQHERYFLMGQTPKGRRVSLAIYANGLSLSSAFTWKQVSWIDMYSSEVQQLKIRGGSGPNFLQKDLEPSTSFVVVFCSHLGGLELGHGFSLYYEYY